ncbi:MAG: prepilin-type N-terminal cleavage/methylation domain-containing protein [Fimbriimonas sp.]
MPKLKAAFTLIELLVVIAIIAILAAILFPVFAQAKAAAKKTTDLSNVKQIGTAMQIYVGDYDDTTPTILGPRGGNTSYQIDWYTQLYPYVKNMDMFFSPGRRTEFELAGGDNCDDSNGGERFNKKNQCLGYGYNWGFTSAASSGLVGGRTNTPEWRVNAGKNLSVIDAPAQMIAFGDTGDSPRYTICANYIIQYYEASLSALFFGGQHNQAFVDGHAKSMPYTAGLFAGSLQVGLPKARTNGYMFCDNPDALDANVGMTCRQYVDLIYDNTTYFTK